MRLRDSPLSRLLIWTRAPATGAPAWSVTTPAMVPVGACAGAETVARSTVRRSCAPILIIVVTCSVEELSDWSASVLACNEREARKASVTNATAASEDACAPVSCAPVPRSRLETHAPDQVCVTRVRAKPVPKRISIELR